MKCLVFFYSLVLILLSTKQNGVHYSPNGTSWTFAFSGWAHHVAVLEVHQHQKLLKTCMKELLITKLFYREDDSSAHALVNSEYTYKMAKA